MKEKINQKITSIRSSVKENSNPNSAYTSPNFEDENQRKIQEEEKSLNQVDKIEQKRLKKVKNDSLELRLINTERLKPIKVENGKGGYIKIKEDGWVVQYLHK